jgi:hypothetical protein
MPPFGADHKGLRLRLGAVCSISEQVTSVCSVDGSGTWEAACQTRR